MRLRCVPGLRGGVDVECSDKLWIVSMNSRHFSHYVRRARREGHHNPAQAALNALMDSTAEKRAKLSN